MVLLCRGKLRQLMYSCLHQAVNVLGAPVGMIGHLVPIVVDSLVSSHNFCSIFYNRHMLTFALLSVHFFLLLHNMNKGNKV